MLGELAIKMGLQIPSRVGQSDSKTACEMSKLTTQSYKQLVPSHWCGDLHSYPSMLVALCCQTSTKQDVTPQTWYQFKELGVNTSLEQVFCESA